MTWGFAFRVRQYVRGSLWLLPLAGGLLGIALSSASVALEGWVDVPPGWQYSSATALTVLTTVVGATVGLTGFVVTVSVLVVQMATGMFSARYLRLWYRDGLLKAVLAVLVGTFSFSFVLLRRTEDDDVPHLGVSLAGLLLGVGIVLFLVFLDRFVHRLRPVAVASLVARAGRSSLRAAAAEGAIPAGGCTSEELRPLVAGEPALVVASDRAGAIQAIDVRGLVRWAQSRDSLLVLTHAVGDFVSRGSRFVEVYGEPTGGTLDERRLRGMVVLGVERTIDQDPAFALRILVDVAIRALSPAVNDPTTATQVVNHLEDTLVEIGSTPGLDGALALRDGDGTLRLVIPAHRWEDFLSLGFTEIRQYGASSIQVLRRLRAALETLRAAVRPEYVAAVDDELARLEATLAGRWAATVDLDRAGRPDTQGIGGPQGIAALRARLASDPPAPTDAREPDRR